jgi:IclR family transcriptional regulator, KDG regulon repressor
MALNSIQRCLRVIDHLSRHPNGLKLTEMSRTLDLHPSSLHRMLGTLMPHDYIVQDQDTKKYALGFRFLEISRRLLDNMDIRKVARKYLEELQQESREAAHLAILRGRKVVYIDKIGNPEGLSLATYIGFATDPHAASGGKVLLADLPPAKVKAMYAGKRLKKYGHRTITHMDRLLQELETIRKQGYALDDEEYYEGARCVAAPVRAGGRVIASVSITGSIFTMTRKKITGTLKDLVIRKAQAISAELNW